MKALALPLVLLSLAACTHYDLQPIAGVQGKDSLDSDMELGKMHLRPSMCTGVDLAPDYKSLDETSLAAFLKAQGVVARISKARADLVFVEVQPDPSRDLWVRLRVAVLDSPALAGQELERAIAQQGTGAWGVHRSNVAILAPRGRVEDILAFAGKTKLPCWGVLTIADGKEATVVSGGYREL